MKYNLYTTYTKAWDAMLEAIDQAEKSIFLEMYMFTDDTKEHDFIGKLKQKASAGVQVVIVADAFGSKNLKKIAPSMREAGIEIIFFSHWLRHIHRKILIIDEKIAFIGGMNIGEEFKDWNDLLLKVGGGMMNGILKSFTHTYKMAGGQNKKILSFGKRKIEKLRNWILDQWPSRNIYTLREHYVEKIPQAKKKIQILTPYFAPPRWLISLLDDACRRNVSVEIIIPQKTNWSLPNRINYHFIKKLHPMGIKFFLTEPMNHSKLLLIDQKEGLLGSQNIDPLSFRINMEAGIFFQNKRLVKEVSDTIEKWKKNSTEFSPENYKMKLIDYLISIILKIFYPVL